MCGRMALTLPQDAIAQLFTARPANDLPPLPNFNICPTDAVHIVTRDADGGRKLGAMRWGFIPHWHKKPGDGPLLINARAETIAEKPAFRDAVRKQRGLIVASGYYEWTKDAQGQRQPWYITRQDGAAIAFAAIWQDWAGPDGVRLLTCAVVTTAAQGPMTMIHHRAPVIIAPPDWGLWLGEKGRGAAPLMQAAADDGLCWTRVGREVNSNRAAGAALIEPLTDGSAPPPQPTP